MRTRFLNRRRVCSCLRGLGLLLAFFISQLPGEGKIVPRRNPLDGAQDATVIVIMRQESPGVFRVEETFLGDVTLGQSLLLPGFAMAVEDTSTPICCHERIEPIFENTRILVFLKPAAASPHSRHFGDWAVAGMENCYFWSYDPDDLDSLRSMAKDALALRKSWNTARNLPDPRKRVEALWPYVWSHEYACHEQTQDALQALGPVAGDYVAEQWDRMTYRDKGLLLRNLGKYGGRRLHSVLLRELERQQAAWQALLDRRGKFATYEEVNPPGRAHYYPRRQRDAEADEASDIGGVLYSGLAGLKDFRDRSDLPFVREVARWAVKYRFKQVGDAALEIFGSMPDRTNLAVIQTLWVTFSTNPREDSYEVMKALAAHRYPETIPLMVQFVNVSFASELARQFLVEMTGVDFGGDTGGWLRWYESHKGEQGVPAR